MSELVQNNTAKNNPDQSQATQGGSRVLRCGLSGPDKYEQEEKSQMNPDLNSK
jgi:hypothetical protein